MRFFRISKRDYIQDLSGTGAGLYGARWNPKGMNMLYTSSSVSLASLEYLVHNYHLLSNNDVVLAEIEINPSSPIEFCNEIDLPADWNEHTYTPLATQQMGAQFLMELKSYVLRVPSAIVPMEYNFLLNPQHEAHDQTVVRKLIDPFEMDDRLFLKK